MREKEWWQKNTGERVLTVIGGFFYGIWFVISRTIYGIYRLLRRLAVDVFTSVYGKIVAALAVVIFAWVVAAFTGLISR